MQLLQLHCGSDIGLVEKKTETEKEQVNFSTKISVYIDDLRYMQTLLSLFCNLVILCQCVVRYANMYYFAVSSVIRVRSGNDLN